MRACTPGELEPPKALSKQLPGFPVFPIQVESLDSESSSLLLLSSEQENNQNN